MSTTIAIVLNVSGTAWAEAPDGSRRLLEEGSALMAGERLVTEDNARVQLDFGYDNLTVIEGGTTILATAEMASDFMPESADNSIEDDSVAQALASIEAALGGSIEDAEAPAAGLEGGSSGGSSTVRLARIVENIDPAEFSLETSSVANRQFIDELGGAEDGGDINTTPDNVVVLPGDISIDSVSGGSAASPTLIVSGSSSNLLPSSPVQVTITDQDGNTASQQIMTGPNGEFTSVFPQVSGLVDGPITVVATGTGLDGGTVSDTGQGNLDVTAGALDVSIDNVDGGAQTIDLSGTTNDVSPGESVSITITDADNNVVTTTAIIGGDGSYSVTGTDISGLVDGALTVDASATDRNGQPVSDTATGALDAVTGDLDITSTTVNDTAGTLDVTGTTNDVAPGESVAIIITDADNNVVNTTAIVSGDGSYTVTGTDISGLVDGDLTVDASATDRNGNPVSDTATDALDALAGDLTVAIDTVNDGAQTIDLSGTTTDVSPGESVAITITDADNNVVNTTATVGSDGSYTVTGTDISSLVDGALTVDASATDRNGNPVSDTAIDALDALTGDLDITSTTVNDTAGTLDVTGTTNDVAPGESVAITITDADNNVVNTTAIVGGDGSYTVAGTDISDLVDGALTVDASATDRNGNPVSDAEIDNLDATQGNLTVAIDALDNTAQTMNLSGTTTDVKSGDPITITVTDTAGTVLTVNTTAGFNGAYEVDGVDVSTLVDGTLTVKADAIDRNGVGVSDTTTGTLDANASPEAGDDSYGINAIQGLFGEYFAYQEGPDGGNLGTLARADAFLAANQADATFTATSINYRIPNGNLGSEGKLQSFLGTDAGSLSSDPVNSSDAIIRMTGEITLSPGTYQFRVTADDGYRILVDGDNVAEVDKNQAPRTNTNGLFALDSNGPHSIEIVYWDQGGQAQLKIEVRQQLENGDFTAYRIFSGQDTLYNGIDSALVTDENQALTIAPSALLGNDADADGDSLSIQSVQGAVNGEVSLDASGNVLFTPDAYYIGEATFDYTVSDGRGGQDTATVTLNVRAAADSLSGTNQADTLNGTGNDDVIRGLAGDDTLSGGAGNDVLIGGIGADVFRWALGDESSTGTTNDVVTDFTIDSDDGYTPGSGQGDQLELSDLLQGADADGNTTASDISGYLMAEQVGDDTVLYLNKDGGLNNDSDNAQQSITLSGVTMNGSAETFIDTMLANDHIKIE